ncbi:MAG: site-specific integrase [Chthoniobacter sp.]|nr:site-specific integrase [Chthoniobacter sp.]
MKARPTANPSSPWLVNLPSRFTSSGKRERHFFKKKTEADEFARRQRIRLENYGSSGAVLPAGRVEEAAIAFERLNPLGVSLTQVVDEYVARREREGKSVTLREAFRRFEDFNPLRRSQAYRIQLAYTLRKFERLQDKLVASIARDEIEGALAGAPPSARNAFLRVLSAVFNYCIKRDWLETNPVQKVDRADVPRGAIKILQVGETRALLSACLDIDRELIPYHALGLFAGIRPNELNRMVWEQIHMKDKEIKLPPDVVKTRNGRVIAIEPTLAKWLKFHVNTGGNRTGEIAPKNNQRKRLRAIRRKAGTVPWVQDVLRHSYASHWLKAFGDKGKLLGYMGHATDDMLLEHYLRAVDRKTAALYWKITPPGVPRKRGDEVHCAGT